MHRVFWILLLVGLLFGSPYAAMMLFNAMGPWESTAIHTDGSLTHMRFDAGMRPPDFVPLFPGAQIVQSGRIVSEATPSGIGFLDLAARGSADEVRDFYIARLRAAGFEARELDTPGLNPMTAAYLGLAGSVIGKRPATDDVITVQIRTEEGIFVASRLLQINWRKISEWPAGQAAP
jgi:hypothetical protein